MKTYKCFSEHCNKELFGESLADALLHAGPLPSPGKFDGIQHIPGPLTIISRVIGMEDTRNATRGWTKFESAVIEDVDGIRKSIHAYCDGEVIT